MPTRVDFRVLAFLALGGCGGIEIDLPELETGDVDGGLEIGGDLGADLDDGFTSDPDDDDGEVDDGDDGEVDGDDDDDDDGGDTTGIASSEDGSDDGGFEGDCCASQETPGCEDHEVSACVCLADPFCCEVMWDGICVGEVNDLGCGMCEGQDDGNDSGGDEFGDDEFGDDDVGDEVGSDDGNDSGANTGPCCEAHGSGGCEYADVATCVCEADPFCCENQWDGLCVAEVDMLGCGVCGSLEGGTDDGGTDDGGTDDASDGGTTDGASTGACCEAHDSSGCEYPEVEDCVCLVDPFCCDIQWDALCVDEVETLVCGVCV